MTPLHIEILIHACCRADVFPRRGAPAVEIAVDDLVAQGAIERCDPTNTLRATPMGQKWLTLICRTWRPSRRGSTGKGG